LKAQLPAEGILLHKSWGDTKQYVVTCECTDNDHEHHIWVEADDSGINVNIYTYQKTDYWTQKINPRYDIDNTIYQNIHWYWVGAFNDFYRRVKLAWQVLTKGYIKYEATLSMSEQQALNYAETLKSAITDVKKFKKEV
jgi:hypothetical protein